MKVQVFVLLSLCISLIGCETENNSGRTTSYSYYYTNTTNDVSSTKWVLAYFLSDENEEIIECKCDEKIGIHFLNSEEIIVYGYCNTGSGKYAIHNGSISFTELSFTEKACSPIRMNKIENNLMKGIMYAEKYEMTKDSLKIYSKDFKYNHVFYKHE